MKDYSKDIDGLVPAIFDYPTPNDIRKLLQQLESVIRKDVEEDEARLKAEIERLKEENENLKDLNNQLQLQAKEAPLPTGKPDSERLHDYIVAIIGGLSAANPEKLLNRSTIVERANNMLNAWKEATKS